jgi:hypothetical protein
MHTDDCQRRLRVLDGTSIPAKAVRGRRDVQVRVHTRRDARVVAHLRRQHDGQLTLARVDGVDVAAKPVI